MLAYIPLLPFVGFLVNVALGHRLSKRVSGTIAWLVMAAAFVVSLAAVRTLILLPPQGRVIDQIFYTWIPSGDFNLPLELRLDPLAAVMILVVSGVGFLIHVYSVAYMHEESDSEYARYFSYMNLFAAFMLLLVLGANLLVMFVGWEGVGLCSYLLIGFWFKKKSAADAGKKAFVVNRIGDFGFLLGILLAFTHFQTLDFRQLAQAIAPLPAEQAFGTLSMIALLLFVGATGKSAQIPLYVWLPDAMEGPTPVSALIHAATMVTAGVYMIGRNAVLYSHAPEVLTIVAIIGVVTAFFAATIGLVQNDIKRVLAYSTVSQLGYMFLAMGVGAYAAGIFHLYTHAFFKALLFLGSGAVIHALAGQQDMRYMGGLRRELPLTYWTFLIATLAISGVPGFSGFFSKDEILYRTYTSGHFWMWLLAVVTAFLTATYMFRVVFLTFFGERQEAEAVGPSGHAAAPPHEAHPEEEEPVARAAAARTGPTVPDPAHGAAHATHLHDAPRPMAIALVVLAIGAVVAGYIGVPTVLGGENRIEAFLAPSFEAVPAGAEAPGAPVPGGEGPAGPEMSLMIVSTVVALAGIGLASILWLRRRDLVASLAARFSGLHRLLLRKYYVDEAYDAVIVHPVEAASRRVLWKGIDVGIIDGIVNGVASVVQGTSGGLRRVQTGSLRGYAASIFVGVLLILGYYLWR